MWASRSSELKVAVDAIFNHSDQGFRRAHRLRGKALDPRDRRRARQDPRQDSARSCARRPPFTKNTPWSSPRRPITCCASTARASPARQHALKRVADITIDLFVGLCVLSRAPPSPPNPATGQAGRWPSHTCSRGRRSGAWPTTCGASSATRMRKWTCLAGFIAGEGKLSLGRP